MPITRQNVADQISAYLHRQISLNQLVDWSESQMMDSDFESTRVRDVVARLGLADVREFGLTWEDCRHNLQDLGFEVRVEIAAAG